MLGKQTTDMFTTTASNGLSGCPNLSRRSAALSDDFKQLYNNNKPIAVCGLALAGFEVDDLLVAGGVKNVVMKGSKRHGRHDALFLSGKVILVKL